MVKCGILWNLVDSPENLLRTLTANDFVVLTGKCRLLLVKCTKAR